MSLEENLVLALDIGLEGAAAAVLHNGCVQVLNLEGRVPISQAIVGVTPRREFAFAAQAQRLADATPRAVFYDLLRFVGNKYSPETFAKLRRYFPFDVEQDDSIYFFRGEEKFPSTEILKHYFEYLRHVAQDQVGEEIFSGVLVIPSYFSFSQEALLKSIALQAGFKRITALRKCQALASQRHQQAQKEEICLSFDFDARACEISLFSLGSSGIHILGNDGDTFLGSEQIIEALYAEVCTKIKERYDNDFAAITSDRSQILAQGRLRGALRNAYFSFLSNREKLQIPLELPCLFRDAAHKEINFSMILTREDAGRAEGVFAQNLARLSERVLTAGLRRLEALKPHLKASRISVLILPPLLNAEALLSKLSTAVVSVVNHLTFEMVHAEERKNAAALGALHEELRKFENPRLSPANQAFLALSLGFADTEGQFHRVFTRLSSLPAHTVKEVVFFPQAKTSPFALHLHEGEARLARENTPIGSFVFWENASKIMKRGEVVKLEFSLLPEGHLEIQAVIESSRGSPGGSRRNQQTQRRILDLNALEEVK